MAKRLLTFVVLLLALGQMGSSCHGTETGNPQNVGGTSNCPALTASNLQQPLDDLIGDLCRRIIQCGVGTTTDICVNALNGVDGDKMTDEFGRPVGTTIDQLRADLISGAVTTSSAEEPACAADIEGVACDAVTANVSSDNLSEVEKIVPASCSHVFVDNAAASPSPTSGGCP